MFLKIIMVRVKIFYQSCGNSEFLYLKLRFFRGFLPQVEVFQEILEALISQYIFFCLRSLFPN